MDAEAHRRLIEHAERCSKLPTQATPDQLEQLGRILSVERDRSKRSAS